jgi:hypothetical protein
MVTTNIVQTLVAMGLSALRERVVLPRIVNRDVEGDIVGQRLGATVNVAVPASVATRVVAPDVVPPSVPAVTPTSVPVALNQWYESPFAMDDKGLAQVQRGIIPMQVSEAIKSLTNQIDSYLWSLTHGANGFYGYVGTAGSTPFAADPDDLAQAIRVAEEQLMPTDEDTFLIVNPAAKANLIQQKIVSSASERGQQGSAIRGTIGEVYGVTGVMSQNVPTHTAGTDLVGAINDAGAIAAGVKTLTVDGFSAAPAAGDIFTIAGVTGTYVVTSGTTTTTLNFEPGLQTALATGDSNEVITIEASHVSNLLIQRNAMAFAMAPLIDQMVTGREMMATAIDPNSGLSLRLEVSRQHRQTQWAFDALWGAAVVRRELGVRIAG